MARGGAHFGAEELAQVLSHYDVGVIHEIKPLAAGNHRAPKMVIISGKGKFLLKRRPKGKDDIYHVSFAHAIQIHLAQRGFPVTALISTSDEKSTMLQLDHHIYELFKFVSGTRYDGSAASTVEAGRQLAVLHQNLADFGCEWKPLQSSFHDSSVVRRHLKTTGGGQAGRAEQGMQDVSDILMTLYNASSVRVNELGFDSWPQQVVHGDWHPGNMLFAEHQLAAVLDFDSAKISPTVTDLANGMLQFSIVGGRPHPADWPSYLDQAKLVQFLDGYREKSRLEKNKVSALPDLMMETMIAEAILPIAATGTFGTLSGLDFLKMIRRKAEYIDAHRQTLCEAIGA